KGELTISDLNRATIVFKDEAELLAILDALSRHFEAIVVMKNKFEEQWQEASQPPCFHLNLRLKRSSLPLELTSLLSEPCTWVVELQLSMQDFLDVKTRCHALYEILRLQVDDPLPRACPVCGLFQTYVARSKLVE